MEQIRIIKEMRNECKKELSDSGADVDIRHISPRYMVWENVPGAFSSNKGEDFRAVLEEAAKVIERDAVIPGPPKGKWSNAGCIMADGWSIAWRIHDGQFWGKSILSPDGRVVKKGTPQRRRRISLVADFGGQTAPEILFERKSMSGDTTKSGEPGKDAAADVRPGIEETGRVVVYGISPYDSGGFKSDNPHAGIYEAETARSLDLSGGNPACNQGGMAVVQGADMYNGSLTGDIAATLNAASGDSPTHSGPSVVCLEGNGSRPSHRGDGYAESETMYTLNSTEHHAVAVENHPADSRVQISKDGKVQTLSSRMGTGGGNVPMVMEDTVISFGNGQLHDALSPSVEISKTLNCMDDPAKIVAYGLDRASYNQGKNAKFGFSVEEEKIGPQTAVGPGAVATYQNVTETLCERISAGTSNQIANDDMLVANTIVRRLTPLECERLQGFPDHWTSIGDWVDTKGKVHKDADSNKYKALGNSICLPFWVWMAERMCNVLRAEGVEDLTMASLFSGIGGFELSFAKSGCKPMWNSEIEEFPEAVTRQHFGDDEKGIQGDYEQYLRMEKKYNIP